MTKRLFIEPQFDHIGGHVQPAGLSNHLPRILHNFLN